MNTGPHLTNDKNAFYADAWGIRKLITFALRSFRLDRLPKVPWWHTQCHVVLCTEYEEVRELLKIFFDAWYPGHYDEMIGGQDPRCRNPLADV